MNQNRFMGWSSTVAAAGTVFALSALATGLQAQECAGEQVTRSVDDQEQSGCFVDGALHGSGTVRLRRYTGAWAADRPEGRGVFTYPNGDRYEGGYHRGERHGRGVLTTRAGARYDGEWVSGREHGQGQRVWPDGCVYESGFRDGRPHGAGRLTVEGAVFAFRFERGVPVGEGTVATVEGAVHTGAIVNGRFVPGG